MPIITQFWKRVAQIKVLFKEVKCNFCDICCIFCRVYLLWLGVNSQL